MAWQISVAVIRHAELCYFSSAYSEPGPEHKNREGCGTKDIQYKNTLGYMAGLILALICVAAAGMLVVIQWEAWLRGHQWLTKGLIKSRIR